MIRVIAVVLTLLGLLTVGTASAQFNSFPPGMFNNKAALDPPAGGGGACSQFTNWNAVAGLTGTDATNFQTAICGGVSDGWFAKLDGMLVIAAPSTTAAQTNWINPSQYSLTALGCSLGFTANNGCFGGMDADTSFNPSTATSPQYSLNGASHGVWMNTPQNTAHPVSAIISGGSTNLYVCFNDGNIYPRLNDNSSSQSSCSAFGAHGMITQVRTSSTARQLYFNNNTTPVASWSQSTSGLPNNNLWIGGDGSGLANMGYFNAAFWGGALTGTDIANIYSRLNALFTAQGCTNC